MEWWVPQLCQLAPRFQLWFRTAWWRLSESRRQLATAHRWRWSEPALPQQSGLPEVEKGAAEGDRQKANWCLGDKNLKAAKTGRIYNGQKQALFLRNPGCIDNYAHAHTSPGLNSKTLPSPWHWGESLPCALSLTKVVKKPADHAITRTCSWLLLVCI